MTIFLVEQNAFHALRLADRGYVLVNGRVRLSGDGAGTAGQSRDPRRLPRRWPRMSDFDLFMSDWLGDTLGVVLLFNFVLVGPASFAAGQGVAITWRPLRQLVLYTALISTGAEVLRLRPGRRRTVVDRRLFPGLGRAIRHRRLCLPADARAPDGPAISLALPSAKACWAGRSGTKLDTDLHGRGGKPWETLHE